MKGNRNAAKTCSRSRALVSVRDVWPIVSAKMSNFTTPLEKLHQSFLPGVSPSPRAFAKWIAVSLVPIALLCGVSPSHAADGAISIATLVPYAEKAEVRVSIREECGLSAKLSKRILERSIKKNITVVRVGNPDAATGEAKVLQRHLDLRITDAIETSGGLLPTYSLSIDGVLKQDGRVFATFEGTRFSRASLIPFRQGECKVLREAVNLLAKDVVKWIRKPSLDARLGDAR